MLYSTDFECSSNKSCSAIANSGGLIGEIKERNAIIYELRVCLYKVKWENSPKEG